MPAPHEIIAFPMTVWVAPTGTAMPDIDDAAGSFDAAWVKLGTEGAKNYGDGGVTVNHAQSIEAFTGAGGTAPRKAFRTEEGLTIGFDLVDLSPAQYAMALDNANVTTVAAGVGIAGQKNFSALRGTTVETFAVVARGESTVNNALNSQLEIPTAYQSAEPSPTYDKGNPASLAVEFTALEVTAGAFGTIRIQTAVAS